MSMYTQLLDAALSQLPIDGSGKAREAVSEMQRCRRRLEQGTPDADPDAVSAALALQISYDVALLRVAGLVGIESDPSRFAQPLHERTRLERALAERGIGFSEIGASPESAAG
jgi:hypothetical protein